MCKCTDLHYHHCPAILIPFGEAIVGRWKEHFEELLTPTDMLSDKETVMEYSSSGSISLAEVTEIFNAWGIFVGHPYIA